MHWGKKSDLDYHIVFSDISSKANIWNISVDESNEEESISKILTLYSENICFVISGLWNKRENRINTDYYLTGWMLCVIFALGKIYLNMHKINIIFKWIKLSKLCFLDQLKKSYMELLIRSGANILYSIIRMIPLTVMNLSGAVNIFLTEIVVCGIINTLHRPPKSLVL